MADRVSSPESEDVMMIRQSVERIGNGPWRVLLWVGALVTVFSSSGWGQAIPEALGKQVDPPSAEQIAAWVVELDDNRYVVRTNATDKLILAGAAAVKPVRNAVLAGNLEVSTRAIYVLRELAVSLDVDAQESGLEALQQLAESPRRSAARMAREAILALGDVRQKQMMDQLVQLGATVDGYQANGFAPIQQLKVEIGADWKGALKDLQRLGWVRDVYKITFAGPQVTDAWLETITDLGNLKYVAIKNAQITDNALRTLSRLKTVIYVDLMYTPVTDVGFEYLRDMKSVRMIRCFGTRVSREAADRFQADFANVDVQYKMGAFLGVRCQQPPWPCVVQEVTADSAALKAGVKMGDIIVSYNKQPVSDFSDLQRLISRNQVGDTAEIQVSRGGEPVVAKVLREPTRELGIESEPTAIGLKIKKVKPDGAAAKSGVQEGDLIVGFDADRITSLDQLRKLFQNNDPQREGPDRDGRLQILRNAKIETLQVTFGQWDE